MARNILSWLAVFLCEAVIIAAFVIYRGNTPTDVLILNIAVCNIILGLVSIDLFKPWLDKHTSNLGSMGVRWTVVSLYALLAIVFMVWMHDYEFKLQLIFQGGLFAFLLLGMAAVLRVGEQIVRVHSEEQQKLSQRDDVKRAWRDLLEKMEQQGEFPSEVREKTAKLVQEMRYLSPSNNPEAQETDRQLVQGAQTLGRMVGDYRMNQDQVAQKLSQCERLLQRRRTQYSN